VAQSCETLRPKTRLGLLYILALSAQQDAVLPRVETHLTRRLANVFHITMSMTFHSRRHSTSLFEYSYLYSRYSVYSITSTRNISVNSNYCFIRIRVTPSNSTLNELLYLFMFLALSLYWLHVCDANDDDGGHGRDLDVPLI